MDKWSSQPSYSAGRPRSVIQKKTTIDHIHYRPKQQGQLTLQGATLTHLYHSPVPSTNVRTGLSTFRICKRMFYKSKLKDFKVGIVETSVLSLIFCRNSSLKWTTNGHLHLKESSLSHPFEKQSLGVTRHTVWP